MENPKPTLKKKVFGSRLFVWGGVIILVLIVVGIGKAALKKHDISTQVQTLNNQVSALESQNTELSGLIQYFQTKSFEQRQARENLGLKNPGETVVALSTSNAQDAEAFSNPEQSERQQNLSNPQKWWNYFFSIQFK